MTGIRLRQESTLKDDEIEWEKKTAMLFLECLSGRSLREAKVDPVHLTVYLFLSTSGRTISVPKHQNPVRLIFGKNELEAFLESLRPPLSIACHTMAMVNL